MIKDKKIGLKDTEFVENYKNYSPSRFRSQVKINYGFMNL